ncbi:MAG: transposase [Desulfobulbus sp.]
MKLTNIAISKAKAIDKTQKLFDGGSLFLEITTKGAKRWRFKYRFGGKEKLISLGLYPEVSLKDARERHLEARKPLANGINPSEIKKAFKTHLAEHGGKAKQIVEVVSDMSGAFITGVKSHFPNSAHTVDWFHVAQLFTKAIDDVRRAEAKEASLPKATRWATLKNADGPLTENQVDALAELMSMDMQTSRAWRIKEMLRWVRNATTMRGAQWRLTNFVNMALKLIADVDLLKPVRNTLKTVEKYRDAILARWVSGHNNARIEALNGIFQAAKCRARGYRNDDTFISIIYLLAAPIQNLIKST